MRWHCPAPHPVYYPPYGGFTHETTTMNFPSFGEWCFHRVFWHRHESERMWRFTTWLMDTGFIDAEHEGGIAFWRWDFWNAKMRAEIRRQRDAEWKRKRDASIARWGA